MVDCLTGFYVFFVSLSFFLSFIQSMLAPCAPAKAGATAHGSALSMQKSPPQKVNYKS
jgi:hypothetical protein